MASQFCKQATASAKNIRALQLEFTQAYSRAISSKTPTDVQRAQELKSSLAAAMLEFAAANKTLTVPKLVPDIFANWPSCLETVKVTELNKEFMRESIEIGGMTKGRLKMLLDVNTVLFNAQVEFMLDSPEFTTLHESEQIDLIRLKVSDLGFSGRPTIDKIIARITELGLELCPAEVGPQYCLANPNLSMNDSVVIGMRSIAGRDGGRVIFRFGRNSRGLWLYSRWADLTNGWDPNNRFMFRLRKQT